MTCVLGRFGDLRLEKGGAFCWSGWTRRGTPIGVGGQLWLAARAAAEAARLAAPATSVRLSI